MRPHGRARADRHDPRAWAVCDSCGFLYNKIELRWQYEWAGNRLVNQNALVCEECYDVPQEQLRVIILPADPEPVANPRPERYTIDNNPIDTIGNSIGTLIQNAGIAAAFDSNTNKPFFLSAALWSSTAGLTNTVGKDWTGLDPNNTNGVTVSRFVVTAPNDAKFLASGPSVYEFQGSNTPPVWTTLATGSTAGTVGEVLDVTITPATGYLFHQFALTGDGTSASIAQLQIYRAG
jgi:hypothetical protein